MADLSEDEDGEEAVVWGSAYPPSINAGIPKLGALPAGWSRLRMKDMLDVIERPVKLDDSKCYRLVTAKRSRGGIVSRGTLRGDEIKVKQQFEVRAGDFILSNRQIAHGGCGIVPPELDGAVVSGEYTVLHPKPLLNLRFLHYLSHSAHFQQICFHSGVGVHVEKLVFRLHDWLNWQFDIPSLPEQRRIAEILSDFDRAIDATNVLVETKQRRKRALMQRIFATSSEQSGALPNGWTRKRIDQVAKTYAGGTPDRTVPAYFGGTIPWVKSGEVVGVVSSTEEFLSDTGLKQSSAKLVPAGATLIAMYGANAGNVGHLQIGAATNQAVLAVIPKTGEIDTDFLNFACQVITQDLLKKAHGSGQPNLSASMIKEQLIVVPPRADQSALASVLVDVDRSATIASEMSELLVRQRRSLMHRLLTPSQNQKALAA